MKRLPLFLFALTIVLNAAAQQTPERTEARDVALLTSGPTRPDVIDTDKGPLQIQPVHHAAMVLTWNGKAIYVDPYGGAANYKTNKPADVVLITDIHPDHLDSATLASINTDKATFIVPKAVADKLPAAVKARVKVINNGENLELDGIKYTAIPMYNLPETPDAMHTKGRGNGYVLEMGGKRIYIAGDTEDIKEMRELKNIDIAFVPMNLPYTMDVNQAASAVLEFKPKIVYPYHYRGKDGLSDVESFKKQVNDSNKSIDVRLRDWYTKSE
ncbi:MAG TPA: MBL fold metallo-hydrolase [Chitinophagales bacterium]|nr:MBL fold metallo-hydrolase [Chitinophagales bacterium]